MLPEYIKSIQKHNLPVYIIPVGFRCYTRPDLRKAGITGKSGPFDNGFFPPNVVMSMLLDNNIKYDSNNVKYATIKPMKPHAIVKTTTREKIDKLITDTNRHDNTGADLIDGAGGYFTYTDEHKFILCHYLTHDATAEAHIAKQMSKAQDMLRRRIERIREVCSDKKIIPLFVYRDPNGFNKFSLDNKTTDLSPTSPEFNKLGLSLKTLNSNSALICFHELAKAFIWDTHVMCSNDLWHDFIKNIKANVNIIT